MTRWLVPALLAAFMAGCPAPQCEVGQTRCNGETAEICDSAQQWSYRADCEFITQHSDGEWVCQDGTCVESP